MKTPHASFQHPASHRFHQINWKPTPCLITKTEYLPCFIVKSEIKCVPTSWLIIAFSDTDLTLQFCFPCHRISNVLTYSTFDCLTWEQWPAAWTGILDWCSTSRTIHGIISIWIPGNIQSISTSVDTLFSSHLKKKISTVHSDIYIYIQWETVQLYVLRYI